MEGMGLMLWYKLTTYLMRRYSTVLSKQHQLDLLRDKRIMRNIEIVKQWIVKQLTINTNHELH